MAIEKSPYEGTHDDRLAGHNALGKIVSVDAASRTCRVKTIGKKGYTDDLDLYNVQWINLTASTTNEGDEDTSIPRTGQMGVITFIGNEPYIMGYYRPLAFPPDPGEQPVEPDPEDLLIAAGDRILRTVAGNRVILRSGGSVEIESNKLCRTYWIPSQRIVNTVCGTHELETDGGFMYWTRDQVTDNTKFEIFAYDQLNPGRAVSVQLGAPDSSTDEEPTLISIRSGDLDEQAQIPNPAFNLEVGADGSTSLTIGDGEGNSTFELSVGANGSTNLGIGLGDEKKATLSIDGESGDIDLATKGKITQTVEGDMEVAVNSGDVSVSAAQGNVTIDAASGDVTATSGEAGMKLSQGKAAIGTSGAELIDQSIQELDALIQNADTLTMTPIGPGQLNPAVVQLLSSIKSKLSGIKGSL